MKRMRKISTLEDLKLVLDTIPDDVANQFSIGFSEDANLTLLLTTEKTNDGQEECNALFKKYPALHKFNALMNKIIEVNSEAETGKDFDWSFIIEV